MDDFVVYFDGSSLDRGRRGGPGFSAGAAILVDENGIMATRSVFLRSADAHTAEFQGLLCGLRLALEHQVKSLRIYGDSRIVIDQIVGKKTSQKREMMRQQIAKVVQTRYFRACRGRIAK